MITDVPKKKDYERVALSFLTLAWETAIELAMYLDMAKRESEEPVRDEDYWAAAQTPLASALTLQLQAMVFGIQSRIAALSPCRPVHCEWLGLSFSE